MGFPSKNTGVGCHFLLQGIFLTQGSNPRLLRLLHCRAKFLQSCPTLFNFMDCSPPGSSVHGIPQAWILDWVTIPFSRGSSWPRDQTASLASPAFTGGLFTTSTTWKVRDLASMHACMPNADSVFPPSITEIAKRTNLLVEKRFLLFSPVEVC